MVNTKEENAVKNVLVVDDAAFMRMVIKMMLERNGYKVVGEAENGQAAILKYKELHPDLVTMDITMPVMSGIDACKEICKYDSNAKIVMVSAMGQDGLVRDAITSGAKSFIVKPYKEEHVLQTIGKILEDK